MNKDNSKKNVYNSFLFTFLYIDYCICTNIAYKTKQKENKKEF